VSTTAVLSPPAPPLGIGPLLRRWRDQRRLSQMELALEADVSTRHLSFVETGRSKPSRDMVVRLAEHLDVPLRERNELLLAAGYAPAYPETSLEDAELGQVRGRRSSADRARALSGGRGRPGSAAARAAGRVGGLPGWRS
jgi:transcriptional regulator with XRE-family HTH domain